jgi:hypothetical protein
MRVITQGVDEETKHVVSLQTYQPQIKIDLNWYKTKKTFHSESIQHYNK